MEVSQRRRMPLIRENDLPWNYLLCQFMSKLVIFTYFWANWWRHRRSSSKDWFFVPPWQRSLALICSLGNSSSPLNWKFSNGLRNIWLYFCFTVTCIISFHSWSNEFKNEPNEHKIQGWLAYPLPSKESRVILKFPNSSQLLTYHSWCLLVVIAL